MGGYLYPEGGFWPFLLFTLILGGVGAWASGRAFASTWRSIWVLPLALLVLSLAIMFLHYALTGSTLFPVQEELLSAYYLVVNFVTQLLFGSFGFKQKRAEQMAGQYSWLFNKSGPIGWTAK